MELDEYNQRMLDMRQRASGRWTGILKACGVNEAILNRKNQPCPMPNCGGEDRFQYTDKFGEGNYICRHCGPGGGFKLLMAVQSLSAGDALRKIEQCLGMQGLAGPALIQQHRPPLPGPGDDGMLKLARRLWIQARPIAKGDPVDLYLRYRGVDMEQYPPTLRCHMALGYYEVEGGKSVQVGEYAAMLASVQDKLGQTVNLHRTYLHDGRKAPVPAPRKLLVSGLNGESVRFGNAGTELATCEGLENGLAVYKSTGQVIWPALTAGNLEKVWVPESAEVLRIYGDNDADSCFDGQASAYIRARSFSKSSTKERPRRAEVFIPKGPGRDWADVYLDNQERSRAATGASQPDRAMA